MSATTAQAADPSASPPWPLAVGVLLTPHDVVATAVPDRRLTLALGAYRLGYYLLDVILVEDGPANRRPPARTPAAWASVEDLVARSGADALVVGTPEPATSVISLPVALAELPLRLLVA